MAWPVSLWEFTMSSLLISADGVALGAAASTSQTSVQLIVFVAIMLHKVTRYTPPYCQIPLLHFGLSSCFLIWGDELCWELMISDMWDQLCGFLHRFRYHRPTWPTCITYCVICNNIIQFSLVIVYHLIISSQLALSWFLLIPSCFLWQAPAAFGLVSFLMHAGLERNRIRKHLLVFALAAPALAMLTFLGLSQVNLSSSRSSSSSTTTTDCSTEPNATDCVGDSVNLLITFTTYT